MLKMLSIFPHTLKVQSLPYYHVCYLFHSLTHYMSVSPVHRYISNMEVEPLAAVVQIKAWKPCEEDEGDEAHELAETRPRANR